MTITLADKKCIPCEGAHLLSEKQVEQYQAQINKEWHIENNTKLRRSFKRKNFQESMDMANRIAQLAEEEDHHPDLHIHYKKIIVDLTTHAIGGLSENDFILAAKIDEIAKP